MTSLVLTYLEVCEVVSPAEPLIADGARLAGRRPSSKGPKVVPVRDVMIPIFFLNQNQNRNLSNRYNNQNCKETILFLNRFYLKNRFFDQIGP